MSDPRDLVLGFLGRGPANRQALIGMLLGRGYAYDNATASVGLALLELQRVGRIESLPGDIWRVSASTPIEAETGKCGDCENGRQAWGFDQSGTKYRPCPRCNATGQRAPAGGGKFYGAVTDSRKHKVP